ncbi:MAG: 30S ribosomal protein S9 [Thermodesulfobacteriota bacterium]
MAIARYYATGKRKTAIARVWLVPGNGEISVNKVSVEDYFGGLAPLCRKKVEHPLHLTDTVGKYDIVATVKGGGKMAQGDALRHGISKALLEIDAENRGFLKKAGMLTRDPRMKERKKYGQKSARARFQFSKR